MTIKQDIEREAAKAGAAVRAAMTEFVRATGMPADLQIEWVSFQRIEDPSPSSMVGRVSVHVGGFTIEA